MSENFLSRWSKRKLQVREQEKLAEATGTDLNVNALQETPAGKDRLVVETPAEPELPLPTEADLQAVEQGGDIKAFMVDKVSKELKNKAFKALFSRPEFNVMDGLDIYIDDYNKFTPLSKEDIGKMTLSKQLLSRPDLEVPKISDKFEKGEKLLDKIVDSEKDAEKVEAESELLEDPEVDDEENPSGDRVIPDSSQVIDSEQLEEKRLFEIPVKQPR